ncbi:MAG: hypothetical protein MUC96_02745 [Myxococcaceae bacterium]|jgi:hypothetical protein|nr:hypothetical protein [Myxococcaceae bacterium]
MRLARLWWLFFATAVLSACNARCVDCSQTDDPQECRNLVDGARCMNTAQCQTGLTCFARNSEGALGRCRQPCTNGTCAQRGDTSRVVNCVDVGQPFTPACIPGPRFDTRWRITIEDLSIPATNQGRFWDSSASDVPDPFVCFTFADLSSPTGQSNFCTDERGGFRQSWTFPFQTPLPFASLQNVNVSVFDSDAIGVFGTCEGPCPELANWPKELAYGQAWDLRPQWDGEDQTFVLRDAAGLELKLRLRETFASQ